MDTVKKVGPTYNSRQFIAVDETASTATVVCYSGPAAWSGEDEAHFVSISDCHSSCRLHKTSQESMGDYISKLEKLRSSIDMYISWLVAAELQKTNEISIDTENALP